MNRYNELKLKVLSLFAATPGEWLDPNQAAEKLDFFPARSVWTYLKRLRRLNLLERRSRGRGTLEGARKDDQYLALARSASTNQEHNPHSA
jgi:DNA-binding IclR family transcriptional regulator